MCMGAIRISTASSASRPRNPTPSGARQPCRESSSSSRSASSTRPSGSSRSSTGWAHASVNPGSGSSRATPTRHRTRTLRSRRSRHLSREVTMTTHIRPYRTALAVALLTLLATVALASPASAAAAADTPRRGGVLLAVIGADPPSLDPHQESTFANIELVAPLYSTLLQIDPYHYPKIIGDVATDWKIAPDGLTYTFKLRPGIRFHDGSALTSADVKATYEKIVFPPAGVRSIRKNSYAAITSIETPSANTIVF